MLGHLPVEVEWASPENYKFVENEIFSNEARNFTKDDATSFFVEVDLSYGSAKTRFRK